MRAKIAAIVDAMLSAVLTVVSDDVKLPITWAGSDSAPL